MKIIDDILSKLLFDTSKRMTIVFDSCGVLLRTDFKLALEEYGTVTIESGDLLRLRIACESIYSTGLQNRLVFVLRDAHVHIMPDILERATTMHFDLNDFCKWYNIEKLLQFSLDEIDYCYQHRAIYNYSSEETSQVVQKYRESESYKDNVIRSILAQWNQLFANVVFTDLRWLPSAADIIRQAISADCYHLLEDQIDHLNENFQAYLKQNYNAIATSSLSRVSPRIVSQVLPFIHAQNVDKKALIVVDGMNIWQSAILVEKLVANRNNKIHHSYTYSWIPSVTDLSRQAIFRGAAPNEDYVQNPTNECKLFEDFLVRRRHIPQFQVRYMHGTMDENLEHVTWLAYVDTTLDDAMHSAQHNGFLLDDTIRWANELQDEIELLLNKGFTIYITSDHGNVYTRPYKRLSQAERVGSDGTYRYITLPQQASKTQFMEDHYGHVMQLNSNSSTFFPVKNLAFSNKSSITHGGTHFLEVLVPFITLSR